MPARKQLLLTTILSVCLLICTAQRRPLELGLHVGPDFHSASSSYIDKHITRPVFEYNMSGYLKVSTSNHFGVKGILQYDHCGWQYHPLSFENSAGTGLVKADITYKISSVNLPVAAEYSMGSKFRLNLDAGLFIGVLLGKQMTETFHDDVQPYTTTKSYTDLRTFNYGFVAGIGGELPLTSKLQANVAVRNNWGLPEINKLIGSGTKTRIITFSAGIDWVL